MLPTAAFRVPMEAKVFEFGADLAERWGGELQPHPLPHNFGLAPQLGHLLFEASEQGQRVCHTCGFLIHRYSLSGRPPVSAGCFWFGYSRWKRGRPFRSEEFEPQKRRE